MALTTSLTTLASKPTPRNGFGGASTVWPVLSSSRITPANPDASAKAPWTRTTVGPGMGSPRGWRGGPNDVTSPDPSEPAQGRAARHVTGCAVPLNRHATTTCKRYRAGREAASGLGQARGSMSARKPQGDVHLVIRVAAVRWWVVPRLGFRGRAGRPQWPGGRPGRGWGGESGRGPWQPPVTG